MFLHRIFLCDWKLCNVVLRVKVREIFRIPTMERVTHRRFTSHAFGFWTYKLVCVDGAWFVFLAGTIKSIVSLAVSSSVVFVSADQLEATLLVSVLRLRAVHKDVFLRSAT
jgi:hypothetical protein